MTLNVEGAPIHRFIFSLVSLLLTSLRAFQKDTAFLQPKRHLQAFPGRWSTSRQWVWGLEPRHGVTSGLPSVLPLQECSDSLSHASLPPSLHLQHRQAHLCT